MSESVTPNVEFNGYIVRFKEDRVDKDGVEDRVKGFEKKLLLNRGHAFKETVRGFSIKGNVPEKVIDMLRADEDIEDIEPDIAVKASVQSIPWSFTRMGCKPTVYGVSNVRIFILDTGVQRTHPDIWVTESLSFVAGETNTDDLNGHGTMSAGCAAARNNSTHVVGPASGAPIHSYKVLDRYGSGSLSNIIAAVDKVMLYKKQYPSTAVIINMSLGGYTGTTNYNSLDLAVQKAVALGITVVVAAGNDAANAQHYTPAHSLEAITVGAYDKANVLASFSNFGSVVDILAPGKDILTTGIGSTTKTASGTSFACPYVAGVAALFLSKNPTATPAAVIAKLKSMAEQAGTSNPKITGLPTTDTTPWSVYLGTL